MELENGDKLCLLLTFQESYSLSNLRKKGSGFTLITSTYSGLTSLARETTPAALKSPAVAVYYSDKRIS